MAALDDRFDAALALATEAGAMALRMCPPPGAAAATLKGAQDWLTEADGAVERFCLNAGRRFPADGFQGEEGGKARHGTAALGGGSGRRHSELCPRPLRGSVSPWR